MKFELDLSSKSVILYNEELDSQDEIKLVESLNKLINDKNQTVQVKMLVLDNVQQQLQSNSSEPNNYLNNIYLVGGAVRDLLMKKESKDMDYVLVGYNENKMEQLGFKKVGSEHNFPIFVDDKGTEFALARLERVAVPVESTDNTSKSLYHNFVLETNNVTIEEDLSRRDLTINSIASKIGLDFKSPLESMSDSNIDNLHNSKNVDFLVDPFNGLQDIKNKQLKHTSEAFQEDPVRILRITRFAARYYDNGFQIADETKDLIQSMLDKNMLSINDKNITGERVFLEVQKGLSENNADVMFKELRGLNALKYVLPELDNLFGVPQPAEHHPEIDSGVHSLMVLKQACKMNLSNEARFAALLHDLGKGVTDKTLLPKHHGHEEAGVPLVEDVCKRLKVPNTYSRLANIVCEKHLNIHKAKDLNYKTIFKLLHDKRLKNDEFVDFVKVCHADATGRLGMENKPYPQADHMIKLYQTFKQSMSSNEPDSLKNIISQKANDITEKGIEAGTPKGKVGELIKQAVYSLKLGHIKKLNKEIKEQTYEEQLEVKNKMKLG
jgi:multifunctional CCA protein